MYEHPAAWRRKLRCQTLVDIAKKEMESGREFDEFSNKLEDEMESRWRLVTTTRKEYLEIVKMVLEKKYVLVH